MDVFETNEERDHREAVAAAAARLNRWAKEVESAQKADPKRCCARVYRGGSWHGSPCSTTAKFHREEHLDSGTWVPATDTEPGKYVNESPLVIKHYCGTHDPVSAKEREEKRWAAQRAEHEAEAKRQRAKYERQDLVYKAVGNLTNEQLIVLAEWLSKTENRQLVFVPQEVQS